MAEITCPTDCTGDLPVVSFSDCAPQTSKSEINRLYMGKANTKAFTTWGSPTEWADRLSQSIVPPGDSEELPADLIRPITVSAEKPDASMTEIDISDGRKAISNVDHVINFEIDDVSQINYDWVRQLECGYVGRFWYSTMGGHLFGGNKGIKATIKAKVVLAKGNDGLQKIVGTISWKSQFTEERVVSPIAA
jgi:hypothetical protein